MKIFTSILVILSTLTPLISQDSIIIKKFEKSFLREDQHFHFDVPIYIPHFSGQFANGESSIESSGEIEDEIGVLPEDSDPENLPEKWEPDGSFIAKLFKKQLNLEFFFTGQVGYDNKNYFVELDSYLGHIGGSIRWRATNRELMQVSIKGSVFRMISGYKIFRHSNDTKTTKVSIEPYWGMRALSLKFRSKTHENYINSFQLLSPLIFEPVLGVRVPVSLRRWRITTQVDFGSFGIQNRWSYMGQFYIAYRFTTFMGIKFGWTEIDFRKKLLFDNVKYKAHLRGPTMGIKFIF